MTFQNQTGPKPAKKKKTVKTKVLRKRVISVNTFQNLNNSHNLGLGQNDKDPGSHLSVFNSSDADAQKYKTNQNLTSSNSNIMNTSKELLNSPKVKRTVASSKTFSKRSASYSNQPTLYQSAQ